RDGGFLCYPGWSQTPGPKPSSQSAGITSVSHHTGDWKKGSEIQTQKPPPEPGPL
uniref:Uncharacterized protein n=1 Tax=Nomascus leucogenys TaxID=61853 RepID=A0A2I3GM68_NOMLE